MHRHRRHRPSPSQRSAVPAQVGPNGGQTVQNAPSIFQRILVWLFHLLVITTPLFFTFTTDELFEFNKMILIYVFVVLITAVWIGRMVFEQRLIWRHTKLDYLLGVFLFSQLLSTVFSIHPYTSWFGYYSRFHGGFVSLLSYALLYWACISNITRKDLRPLALSTMFAGSIVSLYAIGEHFGHSFSCWMNSGGTSFNADCWVQDVQHRVFATFGQPNWLAAYVLMLLSTLIGILLSRWPSRWERIGFYACYALLFWTLLYTRSRSGILGFTIALIVLGVGLLVHWWLQRSENKQSFWRQPTVIATSIIASITLVAVILSGTPYSSSIDELLSRQSESKVSTSEPVVETSVANRLDIGGTDSGEIRKIVWQGALDVWKRYPVLGSGVETFAYSYYQDRPVAHNLVSEWDFLYNKAHNEFLNFLATTGAFGLISYLLLLGGYVVIAIFGYVRLVRTKADDRALTVLALVAAIIGLSISNFFGFSTVVVTALQYLAFAITMVLIVPPVALPKAPQSISLWQLAVLIVVAVTALFPLKNVLDYYRADLNYTAGKALMAEGAIQAAAIKLTTAIQLSPREALFWDELGQLYAQAAVSFAQTKSETDTAQLVTKAITSADRAIELNNRHLNLYKTRTRIFMMLAELDEQYLTEAIKALETAITLSPTDPRLLYNLGLVKFQQGDAESGFALLEKAVSLKPNYGSALLELSRQEWAAGRQASAINHLQQMLEYEPNATEIKEQLASYSAQMQSNQSK